MLRSSVEQGRLQLTADLRAIEGIPRNLSQRNTPATLFQADPARFPPVEDVVAVLDRIVSRSFIA